MGVTIEGLAQLLHSWEAAAALLSRLFTALTITHGYKVYPFLPVNLISFLLGASNKSLLVLAAITGYYTKSSKLGNVKRPSRPDTDHNGRIRRRGVKKF